MTTPRARWRLVVSLAVSAAMGACLATPLAHATSHTQSSTHVAVRPVSSELRDRLLGLVNRSRRSHGLPQLQLNLRLSNEALRHSRSMARSGAISHTPNLADLIRSVGGTVFGEDVGKGRAIVGIRDAWLTRPDTRPILLDPRFHHVGLGVIHIGGFYWVTLQAFD
ncbi:MAG: CAP domain-containing protein [Actinomycetota bacterium]